MALEVKVEASRGGVYPDIDSRWMTRDYTQYADQTLTVATSLVEAKHPLTEIAFMYIVKAADDTETVSVFKDDESTALVFDEFLVIAGMSSTKIELIASASTTLRVFLGGT